MKVLIAAGGTGGHIYPGITVAQTLVERDPSVDVLFVGNEGGLEASIVPETGFAFAGVSARYLQRRLSLALFRTAATVFKGVMQSRRIVKRFRPDVVLGTGGYVSGPVLFAALLHRVPTVIQEQNAYPGLTNRLLGPFVQTVALGDEAASPYFRRAKRVEVTGNPIRKDIATTTKAAGLQSFGLDPRLRTVLVFGGSQGGASLNNALLQSMTQLLEEDGLQIIWQTGAAGFERIAERLPNGPGVRREKGRVLGPRFHVLPYIDNMPAAYAAADLVVCRAGAITLAELTARGLPAVLVPYPYASEDHQTANAQVLQKVGAAVVIPDEHLSGRSLTQTVRSLLADEQKLAQMARASARLGKLDAAERVAAIVRKVAGYEP